MSPRSAAATALVLAAALAAGCGSDEEKGKPIPAEAAAQLESRLAEVERRFDFGGGACADILNDSRPAVDSIVDSLPADVDGEVRAALQDGFDRLFVLTEEQCDEETGQEPETQTEPELLPTETEELPTETEEVPTETEEQPTETEEVPPTETLPTEEEPAGDGGAEAEG